MNTAGGKINGDYGWEISLFNKIRDYSDGITFCEYKINWDRYLSDHTPRFEFYIMILNYVIIEFNIYYLHHRE